MTAKIIDGRDLSIYDIAEAFDICGYVSSEENDVCLSERQAARGFVYHHLTDKRRGYIKVGLPCVDCSPVNHIFIEPDTNGRWSYSITLETNGPLSTSRGHYVRFRPTNKDERERGYPRSVLSFINRSGDEVDPF